MRHSWGFTYPCVSLEDSVPFMHVEQPSQFGLVTLQVLSGHTGLVAVDTEQLWLSHILWLFLLPKLHLGRGIVTSCLSLTGFLEGLLGTNLSYYLYILCSVINEQSLGLGGWLSVCQESVRI